MRCPHCQITLVEVPTVQLPQIDVCPQRHGLWMDPGEITLFLENAVGFNSATSAGAAVAVQTACACPRCNTLLGEHLISGQGIFTCSTCRGWWLPEGVLTCLHETHRGNRISIPLDEESLYVRAAAALTTPHSRSAAGGWIGQGSTVGVLYWVAMCSFIAVVLGLLTWESLRRATVKGHWSGKVDDGLIFLVLCVVAGMVLFWYGFRLNHRKRLIETTPTSPIRSLAIGLVEIAGKAESFGAPLSAPFSAMPCVFFFYKVEERQRIGKENKWRTIAEGQSHQPFNVRDKTGVVAILPRGADLMLETRATYHNSGGVDLPSTVEAGLASLGISSSGWLSSKTLRCTEGFILPDETVYILGTAQEGNQNQSANDARLFVGAHPDGAFIISDSSERDLISRLRWQMLVLLYGGPALSAACLWALLRFYVAVVP